MTMDIYWYVDVAMGTIGHEYRYRIVSGDKQSMHLRSLRLDNAVIHDSQFDCEGDRSRLHVVDELVTEMRSGAVDGCPLDLLWNDNQLLSGGRCEICDFE